MPGAIDEWFARRTSNWQEWPVEELLAAKADTRISLVVPARNEAATVADIVERVHADLVVAHPLVDEIVVIDSDSDDSTADKARAAGAVVHRAADIRPDLGSHRGKGEAMWKSLFVTSGDLLVFMDADLVEWETHFVSGLVGPLLADPSVQLVKAFYDRPLGTGDVAMQGGRVTQLVARPVLALRWPELGALIQPLAGEWAVRREAFASYSVPVGYGVELGAVLDTYLEHGLGAIAQVDLGRRAHSHQSLGELGGMAVEILSIADRRLGAGDRPEQVTLHQFDAAEGRGIPLSREVDVSERPPAATC
jgi:glucosyl-3-phosphoglycerate synthase